MNYEDLLSDLGVTRPAWHRHAACRGMGTRLFFPRRGAEEGRVKQAKQLCFSCPVQQDCLDASNRSDHPERDGIWGGYGMKARTAMRAAARAERVA